MSEFKNVLILPKLIPDDECRALIKWVDKLTIAELQELKKSYERAQELEAKLKGVDGYLEGLSSGRVIGADCNTAGEKAKRYAHQIQMEIRACLEVK